jgi:plasmid replication initiation protein
VSELDLKAPQPSRRTKRSGAVDDAQTAAPRKAVRRRHQGAEIEDDAQLRLFEQLAEQLAKTPDSPLIGTVKNERALMVWSFFAVEDIPVMELPEYNDGKVYIKVNGTALGVPNMLDKEVLIYIISLLQDKINRGELLSPLVSFRAHDFFSRVRRSPSSKAYERLELSLARLKGTLIRSNIEIPGTTETEGIGEGFSWIDKYRYRYTKSDGTRVTQAVVVKVSDWLMQLVTRSAKMLTYNEGYFTLSPLERRLYEVARAHCGRQKFFRMNIEKLRIRVGSMADLKEFKRMLKKTAEAPNRKLPLLDYGFHIIDPRSLAARIAGVKKGRTPLKAYQIVFFTKELGPFAAARDYAEAPLIDNMDDFPASDDLGTSALLLEARKI